MTEVNKSKPIKLPSATFFRDSTLFRGSAIFPPIVNMRINIACNTYTVKAIGIIVIIPASSDLLIFSIIMLLI